MHVARKLDLWIPRTLFPHRFHIARSLRMIATGNYQLRIRQGFYNDVECLDHEFEPLVSSPFSESQDAMLGIAAPGKIRILRSARQHAMGSHVNILAAVFFVKDFAIARHQN
jgi:hypothetical protein